MENEWRRRRGALWDAERAARVENAACFTAAFGAESQSLSLEVAIHPTPPNLPHEPSPLMSPSIKKKTSSSSDTSTRKAAINNRLAVKDAVAGFDAKGEARNAKCGRRRLKEAAADGECSGTPSRAKTNLENYYQKQGS